MLSLYVYLNCADGLGNRLSLIAFMPKLDIFFGLSLLTNSRRPVWSPVSACVAFLCHFGTVYKSSRPTFSTVVRKNFRRIHSFHSLEKILSNSKPWGGARFLSNVSIRVTSLTVSVFRNKEYLILFIYFLSCISLRAFKV